MSSALSVFDRVLGPEMPSGARQVANPGVLYRPGRWAWLDEER